MSVRVTSVYPRRPTFSSVRTEPHAESGCSCTTPIRSPCSRATGGLSVTVVREPEELNGPRTATTVNEEAVLKLVRRKTILNALAQSVLHPTVALLTVPFT